ncbi:hypothetical protein EI555_005019, partial [Monodon monoceros]
SNGNHGLSAKFDGLRTAETGTHSIEVPAILQVHKLYSCGGNMGSSHSAINLMSPQAPGLFWILACYHAGGNYEKKLISVRTPDIVTCSGIPMAWDSYLPSEQDAEKTQESEDLKGGEYAADMLRNIIQMYKNHFYKILRKASEHLELVFGLDVKEVDPNRNTYVLVNKLELSYDAKPSDDREVPKTGVLMTVLGVIVTKGNCATEEQVWELLNIMGLYAGRNNFISGEPKKLIAKDLVQERHLEYCQVANSDPPCYEFLWGPRARAETSKMKVLEVLAKIHDTVPTAFPPHNEEALRDEGERARARAAAKAGTAALASMRSRAIASSFSCPEATALSPSEPQADLSPATCLLLLLKVTMPRGQKSKLCAQEKRCQALDEPEDLGQRARAVSYTEPIYRGHMDEKVVIPVYYLLYKHLMKEPITKADMLRHIIQIYRNHFLEILKRASEHLEMIFGLDLKEVDPYWHIYVLVNKPEPSYDANLSDDKEVPKTGLLMAVLGVILTKGNCATEEQVWQILNVMGLYEGRKHFIFGEPRKLITKDLVRERYLECRQVPNSDPLFYEFLWGPRAHTETGKMKVLEFVAKIHDTVPSAFPS